MLRLLLFLGARLPRRLALELLPFRPSAALLWIVEVSEHTVGEHEDITLARPAKDYGNLPVILLLLFRKGAFVHRRHVQQIQVIGRKGKS